MSAEFSVTINKDSARAADWLKMLGRLTVAVVSPQTIPVTSPHGEQEPAYFLDLSQLTPEEHNNLIEHIATRFNIPTNVVQSEINKAGVPIPAVDCSLVIHHPQKWID